MPTNLSLFFFLRTVLAPQALQTPQIGWELPHTAHRPGPPNEPPRVPTVGSPSAAYKLFNKALFPLGSSFMLLFQEAFLEQNEPLDAITSPNPAIPRGLAGFFSFLLLCLWGSGAGERREDQGLLVGMGVPWVRSRTSRIHNRGS